MRFTLVTLFIALATAAILVVACVADGPNQALSGGEGEAETEEEDPSPATGEGESPNQDAVICLPLILKTCGAEGDCETQPGCVAAHLTADFAQDRCDAALSDNVGFPSCTAGACERLVVKVCGTEGKVEGKGEPVGRCDDAPSCSLAATLQSRVATGDVSAEDSCGSALTDEGLFPGCPTTP